MNLSSTTTADVMTPDPAPVGPDDGLQYAAPLMDRLNSGALPVCSGGAVIGIVADRDISVRATAIGMLPAATEVERVTSERVRCRRPGRPAALA